MSTKKEQKKPQPVTPRAIAVMLMNAGGWYTRRDIAEGLGRKKTSYVVRRIEEATAEGLLLRDYYRQPNGLYCAVYAYNADGDLPF
jgi:prophage antirepressor-like protein